MTPESGGLRLEDHLRASGELHVSLLHRGEGRLLAAAFAGALVLHVAGALLPLPRPVGTSRGRAGSSAARRPTLAHAIIPAAPSRAERPALSTGAAPVRSAPAAAAASSLPAAPAARPLPDLLEPLVEPEPEMAPDDLPRDAEILLGEPEPPPAGPSPEHAGRAADPELLPESRVQPVYPARARQLGVRGDVVLDVSVLPDGTVGEVNVLRCTPPDLGFCPSAVRAVKRWRYRPGFQDGRPAQVSITVKVEFVP
ncbi:MAG: energy transducer TonB [Acidobacteriia bacterium]|nr:energy transducer TonB [Terriglobia bacterium]